MEIDARIFRRPEQLCGMRFCARFAFLLLTSIWCVHVELQSYTSKPP